MEGVDGIVGGMDFIVFVILKTPFLLALDLFYYALHQFLVSFVRFLKCLLMLVMLFFNIRLWLIYLSNVFECLFILLLRPCRRPLCTRQRPGSG